MTNLKKFAAEISSLCRKYLGAAKFRSNIRLPEKLPHPSLTAAAQVKVDAVSAEAFLQPSGIFNTDQHVTCRG